MESSKTSGSSASGSPFTSPGRLNMPNLQPPSTAVSASNTPLHSPRHEVRQPIPPGSPSVSHRSSFVEGMRGHGHRSSSFSHQAVQDLINNPPTGPHDPADDKFKGRDWRTIKAGEIIAPEEVRFVETTTSVEEATKLLVNSGAPNVVLIRENPNTTTAVGAFDYDDLNAYLLCVTGLSLPTDAAEKQIADVLSRAQQNKPVSLTDIRYLLGRKEPPAFLEHTDPLPKAVEIFGSGSHRIIVRKQGTAEVVGVLSQLRLVRFFWENVKSFGNIEPLHGRMLRDLDIGSHTVISINGDKPLREALLLMHNEGITSLPVLDNKKHVVGNISHVDVKHLTTTSSLPLLDSSCIHFITIILSERGMSDGKDSYPVFHVTTHSTLAHTVAKLVATRSHRMWVVDSVPSPASSVPPSPALKPSSTANPNPAHSPPQAPILQSQPSGVAVQPTPGPPYTPATPSVAVSAATLPGSALSGRIAGVVSLTDVLNLYARASGLLSGAEELEESRRRRRRTSSSSSAQSVRSLRTGSMSSAVGAGAMGGEEGAAGGSSRTSLDLGRSMESVRGSTELGRSASGKGRR